jgi:hypothetical protein
VYCIFAVGVVLKGWLIEEVICCEGSKTKVIQKRPVACWKSEDRERM